MEVLLQRKLEYDIQPAVIVDGRIQQTWQVGWTYICASDSRKELETIIARRQGIGVDQMELVGAATAAGKTGNRSISRKGGDR